MPNGQTPVFIKIPKQLLISESAKSYGFLIDDDKTFVPKSQISDVEIGEQIKFWCPEWLVKSAGIEKFICTDYMPTLF